jgi:3-dehydroshikimate dehydratase
MIQLTFCSIAFRDEPLDQVIPRLAAIGYDGIEVFFKHVEGRDNTDLSALRQQADLHRVRLPVFSPYFSLTRGQKEYDETLLSAARAVEAARVLGAGKIRTFTDVGPDGLPSAQATPEQWKQAIRGLQAITALDRGIDFVVETHPNTLADTLPTTRRLLEDVAAPNLKINFQACDDFLRAGLQESFDALAPWIKHLHLQQIDDSRQHTWIEEPGLIDFPSFVGHVVRSGYAETLSVEYCWRGVPWERAESALRYLRPLLPGRPAGGAQGPNRTEIR